MIKKMYMEITSTGTRADSACNKASTSEKRRFNPREHQAKIHNDRFWLPTSLPAPVMLAIVEPPGRIRLPNPTKQQKLTQSNPRENKAMFRTLPPTVERIEHEPEHQNRLFAFAKPFLRQLLRCKLPQTSGLQWPRTYYRHHTTPRRAASSRHSVLSSLNQPRPALYPLPSLFPPPPFPLPPPLWQPPFTLCTSASVRELVWVGQSTRTVAGSQLSVCRVYNNMLLDRLTAPLVVVSNVTESNHKPPASKLAAPGRAVEAVLPAKVHRPAARGEPRCTSKQTGSPSEICRCGKDLT